MITRLKVSNFKSLRELECEFGRLTVIVGPNGCGKSSVLQAIMAVRDICLREVDGRSLPLSSLAQGAAPGAFLFEIQLAQWAKAEATQEAHSEAEAAELADRIASFGVELKDAFAALAALSKDPWDGWMRITGAVEPSRERRVEVQLRPSAQPGELIFTPQMQERIAHIQLYQLDKTIMELPTFSSMSWPVLGPRGEDLASVLDAMQSERREQFEAIESGLRKFIPGLRRVRLKRVTEQQRIGHQVVLDFEFARSVTANHASEGTILLLGLLTVIGIEPGPTTTIMLDDLDRGLHPKAQKQLIGHLHELLENRPDVQIIATTHSPYLVEHLAYEEVLAMTQCPIDGRSLIAPLAKHPDADRWRDEMSAGEFWSSVGEDWVAGE